MEKDSGRTPSRSVILAASAIRDQSAIFAYTAEQWDEEQAELYLDFLDEVMASLVINPKQAAFVPNRNNTRVFVARWNNAHHGHRIFFREVEEGIRVLRIFHTAMNWSEHLDYES